MYYAQLFVLELVHVYRKSSDSCNITKYFVITFAWFYKNRIKGLAWHKSLNFNEILGRFELTPVLGKERKGGSEGGVRAPALSLKFAVDVECLKH
jgi:hypothetical protein